MAYDYSIQNNMLIKLKKEKVKVTLFLMNGFQMQGVITDFDASVVIFDSNGLKQMVYKHAISTITPIPN